MAVVSLARSVIFVKSKANRPSRTTPTTNTSDATPIAAVHHRISDRRRGPGDLDRINKAGKGSSDTATVAFTEPEAAKANAEAIAATAGSRHRSALGSGATIQGRAAMASGTPAEVWARWINIAGASEYEKAATNRLAGVPMPSSRASRRTPNRARMTTAASHVRWTTQVGTARRCPARKYGPIGNR